MGETYDKLLLFFTTRELASIIILFFAILLMFSNSNIRKSLFQLIKIAFGKHIRNPFIVLLLYTSLFVWLFTRFQFWKWYFLKDIVLWFVIIGVPLFYNSVSTNDPLDYFRTIIGKNFKLLVFEEYITNLFTFSLIGEIVLQIVICVFYLPYIFLSNEKNKDQTLLSFFGFLLTIFGIVFWALSIRSAVNNYTNLNLDDEMISIIIPVALSFIYLPITYLFMLYAKYHDCFTRIKYVISPSTSDWREIRILTYKHCGLNPAKIIAFRRYYPIPIHKNMSVQEYTDMINEFDKIYKQEKDYQSYG